MTDSDVEEIPLMAPKGEGAEVILIFTGSSSASLADCNLTVLPVSLSAIERRARLHEILNAAVRDVQEINAEIKRCAMEQSESQDDAGGVGKLLNLAGPMPATVIEIYIVRTTAAVYEIWRAANDAAFTLGLGVQQAIYHSACYRAPRNAQQLTHVERELYAVMSQLFISAQHCRYRIALANVSAAVAEALDVCDRWLTSTQGQQA